MANEMHQIGFYILNIFAECTMILAAYYIIGWNWLQRGFFFVQAHDTFI